MVEALGLVSYLMQLNFEVAEADTGFSFVDSLDFTGDIGMD